MISAIQSYDHRTKLVAQCYDGANVMAGSLNGLQAKIKNDAPNALFTHCQAHRLNLVLQNGSKSIKNSRIYFATLTSLPTFFNQSAKRMFVLDTVTGKRIPKGCDTRWTSRSKIIQIVNSEWFNLRKTFEQIIDDKSSAAESINGARGYLNFFNDFEFAFLTVVYSEIFNITDLLYNILQSKCLDINYSKKHINISIEKLEILRSDNNFDKLYKLAEEKMYSYDSNAPQAKRMKLSASDKEQFYKVLFFEILDNILMQMRDRFNDLSELTYFSLADCAKFGEYRTCFPEKLTKNVCRQFPQIFDEVRLNNELSVIYHDDQFYNNKLPDILKTFVDSELHQIFSEAYKLFVLIATIPVTTVSVERNFSCLKRIKSCLRNSMNQSRLTALSLLTIEKEVLCALYDKDNFTDEIIKKFAMLKDRRLNLIYKT